MVSKRITPHPVELEETDAPTGAERRSERQAIGICLLCNYYVPSTRIVCVLADDFDSPRHPKRSGLGVPW